MISRHRLRVGDARALPIEDERVALVVTSPPYPMIAMWDEVFTGMDPAFGVALARGDGRAAFAAAHAQLDRAWRELHRVLRPGGLACVNVGDATRTLARFSLWPNHARIVAGLMEAGFDLLPDIIWHKPTNAPNKFMGSGMLPGGAYVTYEHEYVLIARKGGPRRFAPEEERGGSAYFWEERNAWFTDLWRELPGARQRLEGARARSAAFPLELPWRLVAMYSLRGDTVLDPFAGTGTTGAAALMLGRDSLGIEAEAGLVEAGYEVLAAALPEGRRRVAQRYADHLAFVAGRETKYVHAAYGCPVVTRQELELRLWEPIAAERVGEELRVTHREFWPEGRGVG